MSKMAVFNNWLTQFLKILLAPLPHWVYVSSFGSRQACDGFNQESSGSDSKRPVIKVCNSHSDAGALWESLLGAPGCHVSFTTERMCQICEGSCFGLHRLSYPGTPTNATRNKNITHWALPQCLTLKVMGYNKMLLLNHLVLGQFVLQ